MGKSKVDMRPASTRVADPVRVAAAVNKAADKAADKAVKGPLMPSSTAVIVRNEPKPAAVEKMPAKPAEPDAPAPLWSNVHGLRDSGFDGLVLIAEGLMADEKAIKAQLEDVKAEIQRLLAPAARRVRMENGTGVAYVAPEPYLGNPKREKLVQLGVPGDVIDKACDPVKPKPYVKITPEKKESE